MVLEQGSCVAIAAVLAHADQLYCILGRLATFLVVKPTMQYLFGLCRLFLRCSISLSGSYILGMKGCTHVRVQRNPISVIAALYPMWLSGLGTNEKYGSFQALCHLEWS